MRYYLYEEQRGGCDFTIGCGRRLRLLEDAKSMEEAVAIAEGLNSYGETMVDTEGDSAVALAKILAVADEHAIDLAALHTRRVHAEALADAAAREKAERAEFERLQKKYSK